MSTTHHLLLLVGFLAIGTGAHSVIDCVAKPSWATNVMRSNPSTNNASILVSFDDRRGFAGSLSNIERAKAAEAIIKSLKAQGPSVMDEANKEGHNVDLERMISLVIGAIDLKPNHFQVSIPVGYTFVEKQLSVQCGAYSLGVNSYFYPNISK